MDKKQNPAPSASGTSLKPDQTQPATTSQSRNQNDVSNPSPSGLDQSRGQEGQDQEQVFPWTGFRLRTTSWATRRGGSINEPVSSPPATPRLSRSGLSRDRIAGSSSDVSTQTPLAQPFVPSLLRRTPIRRRPRRSTQRPPSKLCQVMTIEDFDEKPDDSSTGKEDKEDLS